MDGGTQSAHWSLAKYARLLDERQRLEESRQRQKRILDGFYVREFGRVDAQCDKHGLAIEAEAKALEEELIGYFPDGADVLVQVGGGGLLHVVRSGGSLAVELVAVVASHEVRRPGEGEDESDVTVIEDGDAPAIVGPTLSQLPGPGAEDDEAA